MLKLQCKEGTYGTDQNTSTLDTTPELLDLIFSVVLGGRVRKNKKRQSILAKNRRERALKRKDIRFEVVGALNVFQEAGSLQRSAEGDATVEQEETRRNRVKFEASIGYLVGDHLEPILKISHEQTAGKISKYEHSETRQSVGLGLLFNLPVVSPKKYIEGQNASLFRQAKWIPYGGFIISGNVEKSKSSHKAIINSDQTGVRTKLLMGVRYSLMANLALNSFLTLSFENDTQEANEENITGGKFKKYTAELTFLSLSVYL